MKSLTKHLWFSTKEKIEFLNITREVEKLVKESGVKEGVLEGALKKIKDQT